MATLASTMHFAEVSFNDDKSALFPKTKPKAPNKIDFPAPVSPVIIDKPEEKLILKWLINA